MEYKNLNSTLLDLGDERKRITEFLTRKNLIIVAVAILSLLLIASFGFNVYSITTTAPPTTATLSPVRATFDDQRLLIQPKVKQNGTTIECQREFFLFHIDQNHVCEVTGIIIKNDTNVTIIGNNLTNVLYIFNFEVYKIPKEIFTKFTSLKHLMVNGNHLQLLERDTFVGAENLEVLRLSNNDLKEVKAYIFRKLKNLRTLDLGHNKLNRIEPEAFKGLGNLERLYLSDNNLKTISTETFYPLKKLLSLSLENNQISSLDDDLFKSNKLLRAIVLSNNTFKDLRNELFKHFENLTDLSVSELRINSLDLNGTSISTLIIRNTDIVNITLNNFPKILVSYGTNVEVMKFVINEATADFSKIPNWGGMYYNKNIRFLFYFQREIAKQENVESYDLVERKHSYLSSCDYTAMDGTRYVAVEYAAGSD